MKKTKEFFKLSNEDIIMIVLALMSFSFGVWTNYRQLWLQDIGYSTIGISRLLSVSLICSAVIIFLISFFSTKIKLKNVIMLSLLFRGLGLLSLALFDGDMTIKSSMLLTIMCENIFSVALYPFLATVNKSSETYQKHVLINYIGKDFGVIFCGLLLGVTLGSVVFSYSTCLFLTLILTITSAIILLLFEETKTSNKRNVLPIKKAFKNLFKKKSTNLYLCGQFLSETGYAIIFGMMMLLLTNYIDFSVRFASIFIIICNLLGTIMCSIINKKCNNLSTKASVIIKYGSRSLSYIVAFLSKEPIVFVISIVVAYITTRIMDDKVNGRFIRKINTNSQFLFGNIRYFVLCLADGLGVFLSGILLSYGVIYLFLGASMVTILAIILYTSVKD